MTSNICNILYSPSLCYFSLRKDKGTNITTDDGHSGGRRKRRLSFTNVTVNSK